MNLDVDMWVDVSLCVETLVDVGGSGAQVVGVLQ